MVTKQQQDMANWVLDQVGSVNPYNKQGENAKSQYHIYNMGWLASYLASMMIEDPWEMKRFEQRIKNKKELDRRRK